MSCDEPTFDYGHWVSIEPLLPKFVAQLTAYDRHCPGRLDEFKLAFQYLLNLTGFDLGNYVHAELSVSLPEPVHDFLVFVWERVFPTEPWHRQFPTDVKVKWQER